MARILIIDDEEIIRDSLRDLLVASGHTVDTAKDGFDGMQQFRAAPADIVLCDLIMPYGGIATIRVLRSEYPHVGIIAISGAAQRRLDMSVGIGADDFLAKPFSVQQLLDAINKVLVKSANAVSKPAHPSA